MDDKHLEKGPPKQQRESQPLKPIQHRPGSRFMKKGSPPKDREVLHHGRLPEGNGATGLPAYFPPHN